MTQTTISFKQDPAKYLVPSWRDLDELTLKVAREVEESGEQFDLVVALAKGAWPMSRSLVDYTNIKEVASLGVKFYSGINQRKERPEVYQDLPIDVTGKTILLFDDVADTGESLLFAKQYLAEKGAKVVKTATLFFKARSCITPDYYGAETAAWIIFPFENREMMELLRGTWQERGIAGEEIIERFKAMGFPGAAIKYFGKEE